MNNKVTIFDVANFYINKSYDPSSESFVTPLKLQKLCYYAQAYFLSTFNKRLFDEKFEAWVHGPVCHELYTKYKNNGMNPIEPNIDEPMFNFSENELEVLDFVFYEYGVYDGKYLEYLTHNESPWLNARKGYSSNESCNIEIKEEDMIKEYRSIKNA